MSSVSVVIPCYRYGHYLAECVASVLDHQPGVDVRVLIIDDASPDDSAERARALAAADPRIEVRVHAQNMGHIATYNEGLLEWADGDYSVLLSADDRLTPGALTRAVGLLDAHPEVGFCYGHPVHFQHPGPPPPARTRLRGHTVWPGHWWLARRFRAAHGCITSPEVVVRTALQDQAYYRLHGQNMSVQDFGGQLDNLREGRAAYEAVLARWGDILPDRDELDRVFHRTIARRALRRAARAYDRGRTDRVPVDELVDFARDCWPEYRSLPEYRGLRVRRSIGPAVMPYLQPLVLSALVHKGRERLWWRTWKRRGI
ncbi:MAG: glycosyl transferase family 2 [Actinobacteria bacterium 13_2_20CM_2_71_6]|nr:MAG: glycosyl transferase family 2 [Actinobacteria bacterium 13_2_20CM_2_71_6]